MNPSNDNICQWCGCRGMDLHKSLNDKFIIQAAVKLIHSTVDEKTKMKSLSDYCLVKVEDWKQLRNLLEAGSYEAKQRSD
jgi:hypothetical protein